MHTHFRHLLEGIRRELETSWSSEPASSRTTTPPSGKPDVRNWLSEIAEDLQSRHELDPHQAVDIVFSGIEEMAELGALPALRQDGDWIDSAREAGLRGYILALATRTLE